MEKTKVAIAVESVFNAADSAAVDAAIVATLENSERGATLWDSNAKLYIVDPVTEPRKLTDTELARKREFSARFAKAGEARGLADGSAKAMWSRGTAGAEIRCGLRTIPVAGSGKGANVAGKGTKTATETTQTQTTQSGSADTLSIEVQAMVRDIADGMAHFMAHFKVSKDAREALGSLAARIDALNVKVGNVPIAQ